MIQNKKALLCELIKLRELLAKVQASFWLEQVNGAIQTLQKGNVAEVEKIIDSWLGGWGTLNDLVLTPVNDHEMTEGQYIPLNSELESYRRSLSELIKNSSNVSK